MDAETWMDANKAVELGFADEILRKNTEDEEHTVTTMLFSRKAVDNALINKVSAKYEKEHTPVAQQAEISVKEDTGRSVKDINERLSIIKRFI